MSIFDEKINFQLLFAVKFKFLLIIMANIKKET